MPFLRKTLTVLLLLTCLSTAQAQSPEVGSENLVGSKSQTVSTRPNGSGESNSRNALVERVLAKTEGTIELEYRLPPGSEGRAGPVEWMFPVRVRKDAVGEIEVLNRADLLARRDTWLDEAPQFRSVCGQSIFTWTAIQIYCEVEDALNIIASFDLWVGSLNAGQMWHEPGTVTSQPLKLVDNGPDGQRYEVTLDLDPGVLRRADAEVKISVAMMTGKPTPTLEEALRELDGTSYEGTLVLGFQTDALGALTERTWLREITQVDVLGQITSRQTTTTVQRSPMP